MKYVLKYEPFLFKLLSSFPYVNSQPKPLKSYTIVCMQSEVIRQGFFNILSA